ncbi:uncharacterized protein OCT59_020410 [Rhizophagus irregularis]|uniref:Uncharacterized protein n=3 Tax=Rhizophagus irregularis TaxID=588596 RepID=A0A2I1DR77_9GLOM|nr:hypothetical protein GLOIN_2v1764765 [Rhizophagus irregularis DAOM 181602=DAOM 197198]EXX76342.1 hypothetical protein RirG_034080 [Rhizophagus irregularis DAOM 197198w]PKY12381.1 hypothetical protein RhiirB3_424045 [Rhizophagus irregularis]POG80315.1 hypothetical protein GLOIN_2v1764765 [Rhizophagus irregularis DAOM 181602=DAOM 197198]UZO01904.1 hypothetical protein OCT59_020410 [Rhizophagus irregularis]CAB5386010.1 unnamed protein product [Rhizophagus irregularis]|eukprot:XP_025187181.1 hypothetical protein GLOIN_2v1764765 [Rhizophagus irregularis DAOM 181602=DAOM 197198]
MTKRFTSSFLFACIFFVLCSFVLGRPKDIIPELTDTFKANLAATTLYGKIFLLDKDQQPCVKYKPNVDWPMKTTVKLIRNGTIVDEYKYKNVKDKKFIVLKDNLSNIIISLILNLC